MDVNQIKEEYVIRNLCREAKIMSKLNHPCIAALYQTMQRSDNVYYLVTELVSGGDLCSFVKGHRNGKLEERPTRIYARQFASALSHMHSLGIVHRDLKMENVMLNSIQTQIKIVDFGLSNVWSADNPLRTHCGSPEYAAPELFVTGKQYGAEVDLWSLGIILYGMVLGQLPFVTSRSDYTTSQERRKKLVAQINKGMAAPHRRAIACFSSEFRHLMNRLLVADSTKRMAIKELTVHPWITDKGRRIVRTNPIKNLDSIWQAKIITEIASLIQAEPKTVMSAIAQDPLGKIGGMFNMLVHKYQINQLNGDGVTRTLPSLTLLELSDAQKNINKDSSCLKISTARTTQQRKAFTATASSRRADYCTPRPILVNENLKPDGNQDMVTCKYKHFNSKLNRKENSPSRHRPNTVQIISNDDKKVNMPDYRMIKSPTLRRKAYSANITPKTNRPFSPGTEKRKHPVIIVSKEAAPSPKLTDLNKGDYQMPVIGRKGVSDSFNALRRLPSHNVATKQMAVQKHRNPQTRVHTANIDSRSKSDHLAGTKRPLTGPLNRTLTRSIKHTSACPMAITHSACRTETRASMNVRLATRQHRDIVEHPKQLETSPLAFGDADVRTSTSTNKQGRKPVIYDPIARSIAGYVANNIPDQLNNIIKSAPDDAKRVSEMCIELSIRYFSINRSFIGVVPL